ncbi:MAG: glycosyl hydrolase family 2, partial [Bryobacteraceae bacterium]
EVFAPTEKELGINWVDWNPFPPDKSMGLWRGVYLTAAGPVTVRYPEVVTHFPGGSLDEADLTVVAEVRNGSDKPVVGTLQASIDGAPPVEKQVALDPGEARTVTLTPEEYAALRRKNPALWWPVDMGPHTLHDLTVSFKIGESISDEQHVRFGIREITSELTPEGYRLFRVNGKKILIRGAQWTQDMLLRRSPEKLEAQFEYASALHLNALRLEGQMEADDFFEQADRRGILVMAGWCCCDIWEKWDRWEPGMLQVATESLRAQTLRLRSHPSMLMWLTGSDGPPPPSVEQAYLQVLKETVWPNPILSSASQESTPVSGPSGVKMTGPYDYEPPSYWYVDRKFGGAFGFNTETGPGPAIPQIESLRKMLPKGHLWPIDAEWNYHAGGERFQNVNRFNEGMDKTYGQPSGLEEYERKAQAMAYDGERALFEAYTAKKYTSTGVIQFMLNNGWPSLIWHLVDYYLQPAGGYFGAKKALEPLHIQYSYDDRSVVAVNNTVKPVQGLTVSAHVYDMELHELFSREARTDVDADGVNAVFTIPPFPEAPASAVYFVKLSLRTAEGNEAASNFYWLPTKLSTMAWDKTPDTSFTPIAEFEDMTALNRLPQAGLRASATLENGREGQLVEVKLENRSKNLAFQTRLAVVGGKQREEILPVLWDDNYVSLMPGESRTIRARYRKPGAVGGNAALDVDGWNIAPLRIALRVANSRGKQ